MNLQNTAAPFRRTIFPVESLIHLPSVCSLLSSTSTLPEPSIVDVVVTVSVTVVVNVIVTVVVSVAVTVLNVPVDDVLNVVNDFVAVPLFRPALLEKPE